MLIVKRMYSAFLVENDIAHEDSIFNLFLTENFDEICPGGGVISYEADEVKCGVHGDGGDEEDDESTGDEVPWL